MLAILIGYSCIKHLCIIIIIIDRGGIYYVYIALTRHGCGSTPYRSITLAAFRNFNSASAAVRPLKKHAEYRSNIYTHKGLGMNKTCCLQKKQHASKISSSRYESDSSFRIINQNKL